MPPIPPDHRSASAEFFWGEMSPFEHLVQIYEDDSVFLDSLEEFVGGGLQGGDGVIVVATPAHLAALEERLTSAGIDVQTAALADRYLALPAKQMLDKFMIRGWPDEILFTQVVSELLNRAGKGGRRVRAFGEMVALLWGEGHTGATVRLEHLWHRMCHEKQFRLFCAYPRVGFTQDGDLSMKQICEAHSRVVRG